MGFSVKLSSPQNLLQEADRGGSHAAKTDRQTRAELQLLKTSLNEPSITKPCQRWPRHSFFFSKGNLITQNLYTCVECGWKCRGIFNSICCFYLPYRKVIILHLKIKETHSAMKTCVNLNSAKKMFKFPIYPLEGVSIFHLIKKKTIELLSILWVCRLVELDPIAIDGIVAIILPWSNETGLFLKETLVRILKSVGIFYLAKIHS